MIKDDKGYIEKSRGFRNRKKRRREDTPETPEKPKMNPYKREHLNLLVSDDDEYTTDWEDPIWDDEDDLHSQAEWAIEE